MRTFCQFVFSFDYVGHRVVLILNLNSYYRMYLSLSISVSPFLYICLSLLPVPVKRKNPENLQQPLVQYFRIVNKLQQRKLFNNPNQVNIIKLVF